MDPLVCIPWIVMSDSPDSDAGCGDRKGKALTNLYIKSILCPIYGDIRFGIVMSKSPMNFFNGFVKEGLAKPREFFSWVRKGRFGLIDYFLKPAASNISSSD